MTHTQSTFAIGDFWRFWVVHLWVEDFLELFTTMLVALIFVLMGIVSERFATRLIYFDVMLYSIGGVVGTLHHCYFSGGPAVEMALGAFFSAAEVIPLTLLTVEAWSFLQLGNRQQVAGGAAFPHRWAVMFLASVGFWNFLGAGVFGFLINMPIVSYYEIGTLLTSNHGHAAFMGVYGMLALALLVFCTRYLARPEDWSEGLVRFSFWATNVGLMLMILGHLFPLGVLQLGDVVTNGYWHARTEWFRNYPVAVVGADAGRRRVHGRLGPPGLADPQGRVADAQDPGSGGPDGDASRGHAIHRDHSEPGPPARG